MHGNVLVVWNWIYKDFGCGCKIGYEKVKEKMMGCDEVIEG